MGAAGRRRMSFSFDTPATPEEVFDLVGHLTRHGEWSPQEYVVQQIGDGPIGVGSRFRTEGRKGARTKEMRTNEVEITEYDPPMRFAFEAREPAGTYRTTFTITATADGSHVERTVDPPTRGAVAFVRHDLLHPVVRAYLDQNTDALRAHLLKVANGQV